MSEKPPNSPEGDTPPSFVNVNFTPIVLQPEDLNHKSDESLDAKKKIVDEKASELMKTLEHKEHKESPVSKLIMEFILHIFSLAILCIIVNPTHWSDSNRLTNAVHNLFTKTRAPPGKTFTTVDGIDDVWEYINNQLMEGLYGEPANTSSLYSVYSFDKFQSDKSIFNASRMLGMPRIRMLKVTASSCARIQELSGMSEPCYSDYRTCEEDRDSFNPDGFFDLPAFTYTSAGDLGNDDLPEVMTMYGQKGYGGGGFVQYLSEDKMSESMDYIAFLKANRWISGATRLVVVDFAVYNGRLNLFCVVKLMFEFPANGGVIPTAHIDTLRLIRYETFFDNIVILCEGLFCQFLIMAIVNELFEMCRSGRYYFIKFWRLVELIIIAASITCVMRSIHRTKIARYLINTILDENGHGSYSFDGVVKAENSYSSSVAVLVYFTFLKTVRFICTILDKMLSNISRSTRDAGIFSMMFIMCLFSFVQLGYFATQIVDARLHLVDS